MRPSHYTHKNTIQWTISLSLQLKTLKVFTCISPNENLLHQLKGQILFHSSCFTHSAHNSHMCVRGGTIGKDRVKCFTRLLWTSSDENIAQTTGNTCWTAAPGSHTQGGVNTHHMNLARMCSSRKHVETPQMPRRVQTSTLVHTKQNLGHNKLKKLSNGVLLFLDNYSFPSPLGKH